MSVAHVPPAHASAALFGLDPALWRIGYSWVLL